MNVPSEVRGKFYALRALALFLIVLAGSAFFLRPNSFSIRSLGLAGIMVGVWLVRRSDSVVQRARGQAGTVWAPAKADRRVGPLAWAFTAASFLACIIFYLA